MCVHSLAELTIYRFNSTKYKGLIERDLDSETETAYIVWPDVSLPVQVSPTQYHNVGTRLSDTTICVAKLYQPSRNPLLEPQFTTAALDVIICDLQNSSCQTDMFRKRKQKLLRDINSPHLLRLSNQLMTTVDDFPGILPIAWKSSESWFASDKLSGVTTLHVPLLGRCESPVEVDSADNGGVLFCRWRCNIPVLLPQEVRCDDSRNRN
ncbi:hypothetical protein J6590_029453 [Homalodisca vitripennis]|nr:hypothetical protein J6590_029453 [Homalodisca vitripennis]